MTAGFTGRARHLLFTLFQLFFKTELYFMNALGSQRFVAWYPDDHGIFAAIVPGVVGRQGQVCLFSFAFISDRFGWKTDLDERTDVGKRSSFLKVSFY